MRSTTSHLGCVCYKMQMQGEYPHAPADKERLLGFEIANEPGWLSVCFQSFVCFMLDYILVGIMHQI